MLGGQTKLMIRNASAANLSESGVEPVFRLTGRSILVEVLLCNRLVADERRQYINKQSHGSGKNPNRLYYAWATLNNILHRKAIPSMPDTTNLPSSLRLRLSTVTDNMILFIPPLEIK